jgi:hypothetical protein
METEYHGDPVAGGTFPAEIWHTFMEKALPYLQGPAEVVPVDVHPVRLAARGRLPRRVAPARQRPMPLRPDLLFFDHQSRARPRTASRTRSRFPICRPAGAGGRRRLAGQPLTPSIVYKVARPGQKLDVVLGQKPSKGRLSAYDHVTLVVAKPTHGVVPS